jgi:hypothetical protein
VPLPALQLLCCMAYLYWRSSSSVTSLPLSVPIHPPIDPPTAGRHCSGVDYFDRMLGGVIICY